MFRLSRITAPVGTLFQVLDTIQALPEDPKARDFVEIPKGASIEVIRGERSVIWKGRKLRVHPLEFTRGNFTSKIRQANTVIATDLNVSLSSEARIAFDPLLPLFTQASWDTLGSRIYAELGPLMSTSDLSEFLNVAEAHYRQASWLSTDLLPYLTKVFTWAGTTLTHTEFSDHLKKKNGPKVPDKVVNWFQKTTEAQWQDMLDIWQDSASDEDLKNIEVPRDDD